MLDVICGGFPCQDISVAGSGVGISGKRSSLWGEFKRIIGEFRPKYVIIENVEKLLSRGLYTVLSDLHEIGYDAEWHCITASHVGAPHKRDRIWIIAYRDGIRCDNGGDSRLRRHIQDHFERNDPPLYEEWAFFKPELGEAYNRSHWEKIISKFCKNDDGLSEELDEIEAYGNSVVPQIVEIIGNALLLIEREEKCTQSK